MSTDLSAPLSHEIETKSDDFIRETRAKLIEKFSDAKNKTVLEKLAFFWADEDRKKHVSMSIDDVLQRPPPREIEDAGGVGGGKMCDGVDCGGAGAGCPDCLPAEPVLLDKVGSVATE
jgi:hypothetical protein